MTNGFIRFSVLLSPIFVPFFISFRPLSRHPGPPIGTHCWFILCVFPAGGEKQSFLRFLKGSTRWRFFAASCELFPPAGGICNFFQVPVGSIAHARAPLDGVTSTAHAR